MQAFSSLFPQLPPPQQWASWADLQQLAIARTQAYWARDQAVWSHRAVWVQIAGLLAASLAALFAWQAARASRTQADNAQKEISHLIGERDAASRLQSWMLRAFMQASFVQPPQKVLDEALPDRILKLLSAEDGEAPTSARRKAWSEVSAKGFQLAVGVNSDRVIPLWIALMDCGASLHGLRSKMLADRMGYVLHEYENAEGLGFLVQEEELHVAWAKQSQDVPRARAEYQRFWATYCEIFDIVDISARGGNLAGVIDRSPTVMTATLT